MKILTYAGTDYYVADDVAWVMRFYHGLLAANGWSATEEFPAHTATARDITATVELGGDIPYPADVDAPDDTAPAGGDEWRMHSDEMISTLLIDMRTRLDRDERVWSDWLSSPESRH